MNTLDFTTNNRKAIYSNLAGYCTFAKEGSNDFIEVTEWTNGEGFDVTINNVQGEVTFKLTHGEFKLLKRLVKQLYKDE